LPWFKAFAYAQSEPLVLPAALLLKPAENNKQLQWSLGTVEAGLAEHGLNEHGLNADTQHHVESMLIDNFADLLNEWNKSDAFLPYDLTEMEWSKKHRDWQFILQEQDATALLKHACDHFGYALYQPIYQHQFVAEE
jgi:exodeoxyribonuclease V gamma subunit